MSREDELKERIKDLENQLEPLKNELTNIWIDKSSEVDKRIVLAQQGKGDFKPDELVFAAKMRCQCGKGVAYPRNISPMGAWYCSEILMGLAATGKESKIHDSSFPFMMYSVKSEDQPSANGQTTRP